MTSALPFADGLFFMVLPYLAMFVFLLGTIWRYRKAPFSYSSLSSQFLENHQHFWGVVPFHYGVVAVLLGHIVAFLIPREILAWNSRPLRLYVLESSALIFGLLTVVGLVGCDSPRLTFSKVRAVTTGMDWIVSSRCSCKRRAACTWPSFIRGARRGSRRRWCRISGRSSGSTRISALSR